MAGSALPSAEAPRPRTGSRRDPRTCSRRRRQRRAAAAADVAQRRTGYVPESADRGWAREVLRNAATIVPLETLARGFNGLDEQGALVAYAESAVAAESSARSWVRTLVRSCSSSATDAQSTTRSSSSRSNRTRFMPSGAGGSGCSRQIDCQFFAARSVRLQPDCRGPPEGGHYGQCKRCSQPDL